MNSAIYHGTVRHRRAHPVTHAFEQKLFMMYLDLDELPSLFDKRWLWSARRPAPAWFKRSDYLGGGGGPLSEAVRATAQRLTGRAPDGPIRVLTHLRYFGYVQNPVSFYYCFDKGTGRVSCILAEITNTPWNERHVYALEASDGSSACDIPHDFGKSFHVSPFMPMDQNYSWRFSEPDETLSVFMRSMGETGALFDASLRLERTEIDGRSLAGALARYPLMTAQVVVGIYWQALRLRLKGTPYIEHPQQHSA